MNIKEVAEYLEEHLCNIQNKHKVGLVSDLEYVHVSSPIPGHLKDEMMYIGLSCHCETLEDFVKLFKLETASDIESIKPERMQELFDAGNAEICCISNLYFLQEIYFRKQRASIFASYNDNIHKVPAELITPDDFIGYAKKYIQIQAINEKSDSSASRASIDVKN